MTTITDKENKDFDPTFTRAHYDYTYHARVYGMESLIAHIAKLRKKRCEKAGAISALELHRLGEP